VILPIPMCFTAARSSSLMPTRRRNVEGEKAVGSLVCRENTFSLKGVEMTDQNCSSFRQDVDGGAAQRTKPVELFAGDDLRRARGGTYANVGL
jgi:hypothetical protein